MIKKLIVGGLIAVVVGAIGVGAYDAYQGDSTLKLPEVSLSQAQQGQGRGQGQGQVQNQGQGRGQGQGNGQGQRQGRGQGQGQGNGSGQPQTMEHDWLTLTGTVVSFNQQSMVVETNETGELMVELGMPGFAEGQAVAFNAGDKVTLLGFEGDNGTFQAGQINNETTGQKLLLRDPNGRPLWAGQGQGQQGQGQGNSRGQGQGQGQGNGQGQGQQGRGRGQGQGQVGGQGNGSGQPQAMERDWVTVVGTVVSFDQRSLVIDTSEEGELALQLGPPGFAAEQGVNFEAGDTVTLFGFAGENGTFQAGQISNDITGQKLLLRDPNGRPLWAGRGQGQGHQ